MNNPHPGTVLRQQFLKPLDLTEYLLAQHIKISDRQAWRIVNGMSPMTAKVALRLSKFLKVPAEYWLELQNKYDLEVTESTYPDLLNKIEPHPKV